MSKQLNIDKITNLYDKVRTYQYVIKTLNEELNSTPKNYQTLKKRKEIVRLIKQNVKSKCQTLDQISILEQECLRFGL